MFESWEYFRTIDEAIQLYIPKGHTLRLYGSFAVGKLEHTVVSTSLKSSGFGGHFIQLKKKITSLTIHSICRPNCSTFFSNVSQHRGFWWQRESPLTRHHNSPLTESRQRAEIAVRVNALMIRPKLKHNSVVHRTERHAVTQANMKSDDIHLEPKPKAGLNPKMNNKWHTGHQKYRHHTQD